MPRIYLDHAATTPMRLEAIAAVGEGMRRWANPSSPHAEGRAARAALEEARGRIKAALDWDGELIFTSGASEALAIGLGRARGGRRIVSAVEHESVFRAARGAIEIGMAPDRALDRDRLAGALRADSRAVVALQHVNSETGVVQPVGEVAGQVREAGGVLLSDCSQSAGRIPLPDADMIVVSAHKLGGPPGIGALLLRDFALIEPDGGQEFGYRGGTENLPGALGFAAALDAVALNEARGLVQWCADISGEIMDLTEALHDAGGDDVPGAYWIRAVAMPGMSAAAQLIRFDREGFAVSAGSACSSGTLKQSRALAAFGVPPDVAERMIRISFGWSTTVEDLLAFQQAWLRIADEARARA